MGRNTYLQLHQSGISGGTIGRGGGKSLKTGHGEIKSEKLKEQREREEVKEWKGGK